MFLFHTASRVFGCSKTGSQFVQRGCGQNGKAFDSSVGAFGSWTMRLEGHSLIRIAYFLVGTCWRVSFGLLQRVVESSHIRGCSNKATFWGILPTDCAFHSIDCPTDLARRCRCLETFNERWLYLGWRLIINASGGFDIALSCNSVEFRTDAKFCD